MEPTPPPLLFPPPSSLIPTNVDNSNNNKKKGKRRIIGKGRKKIEIKKIENKKKLEICFSKRYRGFLSMVEEMSTLCGVDVAAVAFSPTGKAYSFANPSVEQLIAKLPSMPHHQDSHHEKFQDDDDDDDDDDDMKYDDVMVQEKMEELRGIMNGDNGAVNTSSNVRSDDHGDQSLASCVFNPFLAAIGDLHLVLGPAAAPSSSVPFI